MPCNAAVILVFILRFAGCSLQAVLILLLHWMHWIQAISMHYPSYFIALNPSYFDALDPNYFDALDPDYLVALSKLSCCCNQITID